jgi:hypothetical protein
MHIKYLKWPGNKLCRVFGLWHTLKWCFCTQHISFLDLVWCTLRFYFFASNTPLHINGLLCPCKNGPTRQLFPSPSLLVASGLFLLPEEDARRSPPSILSTPAPPSERSPPAPSSSTATPPGGPHDDMVISRGDDRGGEQIRPAPSLTHACPASRFVRRRRSGAPQVLPAKDRSSPTSSHDGVGTSSRAASCGGAEERDAARGLAGMEPQA